MKKKFSTAALVALCMVGAASATTGNNGGGNGGCGVGQQTNGCGGGGDTPPVVIIGPMGPQGPAGESITGPQGPAGRDGRDGKDGASITGATGAAGENIKGDKGDTGATGQNAPDAVTVQQMTGAVQAAQAYTTQQISAVREEIRGVAKAAYSGVAAALALQMPAINPTKPDALVMRLGVGAYKGQTAAGISFRRGNKAGDWSVTGGVSMTSAGTGIALGIEHSF